MFLDYSESLVHRNTDWLDGKEPSDPYFFSQRGVCPFCSISISIVNQGACGMAGGHSADSEFGGHYWIWECNRCGWWEIKKTEYSSGEDVD